MLNPLGNLYRIARRCGGLDGTADIVALSAEDAESSLQQYIAEHPEVEMEITGKPEIVAVDVWG